MVVSKVNQNILSIPVSWPSATTCICIQNSNIFIQSKTIPNRCDVHHLWLAHTIQPKLMSCHLRINDIIPLQAGVGVVVVPEPIKVGSKALARLVYTVYYGYDTDSRSTVCGRSPKLNHPYCFTLYLMNVLLSNISPKKNIQKSTNKKCRALLSTLDQT